MEDITAKRTAPFCPSARPEVGNSSVFGVVTGTVEEAHITYLSQPLPVTEQLIALSAPVTPTEVFRIAAPCVGNGCQHFDGASCRLAARVTQHLSAVAENLPPCAIRRDCRWWQQEGKAACIRCPQIITDNYNPTEEICQVAAPNIGTND